MIPKRLVYGSTVAILLSFSIFFKKMALTKDVPPTTLLIQFILIASIILNINLLLFQRKYIKKIKNIKRWEWKNTFFAGVFLISAYFTSTYGLRFTTSINYSFIIKSNLIFVPILAFFFFQEKITKEKIFLAFTFFAGIYLVTTRGQFILPHFGDLLIIVAAFFFSSFSIINKKLAKMLEPEIISWGVTSCAAIFALTLSFILKINIFSSIGILFVFLSGLTEALIILFMNKTIRITSMTYYVMMTMFVPVINLILGILFLNETIDLIQTIGGIILIISGIMVQRLRD
ncbi:MAG: DMT family transporter [Candidatus Caldatribacteriota bacterium]|nr:DMT family transporter [Candidatus Caldatribacteriota bacterium]